MKQFLNILSCKLDLTMILILHRSVLLYWTIFLKYFKGGVI